MPLSQRHSSQVFGGCIVMYAILVIALATLVVGVVVVWTLEDQLCSQLRARHPDLWVSIGSPDRVFDDFGSMRNGALQKLCRQPDMLSRCSINILRRVRLIRVIGRFCLGLAGIAAAVGCAYLLTGL